MHLSYKFLSTSLLFASTFVSTNVFSGYAPTVAAGRGNVYSCSEMRFHAFNYELNLNDVIVEVNIGKGTKFALTDNGTLQTCPLGMTFVNEQESKCVSDGKKFERKWGNSVELIRGVHFQKALLLPSCRSVILVDFDKQAYMNATSVD